MKYKLFKPAAGLKNAHLQTLYPALLRRQPLPDIENETFEFEDGDFTDCYWHHKPSVETRKTIVILFHGLQGSFNSSYIQGMMLALDKAGFTAVLMHFRGCSGKANRLPRSYHSGDTEDAKAWIRHLKEQYPLAPLCAVGYSLGGNMLLKLLGEHNNTSLLSAAVSISAPIQLDVSAKRMKKGFSRFYQYYLLRNLKVTLKQKYKDHKMQSLLSIEKKELGKIKNFYAFDEIYTAPIHGFDSAEDYYQRSSAKQFLTRITIPTLIIQALDDPFMTNEVLPDEDEISDSVELEVYDHGGHVGFVSGTVFKPKYWLEERVINFLEALNNTI
ncbi:MAG: hydrolase [Epsilonproteobacteria bacterium]|nr:MAG: hydrolase [Campylobacterota bacterium]